MRCVKHFTDKRWKGGLHFVELFQWIQKFGKPASEKMTQNSYLQFMAGLIKGFTDFKLRF